MAIARFFLAIGLIGPLLSIGVFIGWTPQSALTALLVYVFLCELYLFLFTLAASSVSASLLLSLAVVSESTESEIDRTYSSQHMVAVRLGRLERAAFLERRPEGGYVLTSRGRAAMRLFKVLRSFFGHA